MKALLCALLFLAALAGVRADPLDTPGPVIVAGQNDAEWQKLSATLRAKGAVFAPFTERRYFPFRTEPTVLEGEMRWSPERGLSLRYTKPDERMMIADTQGIVLRNASGRSRSLKPDARVPDPSATFLPVLRFDFAALDKHFEMRALRRDEAWRLDFTPRTEAERKTTGTITVWGTGDAVQHLALRQSDTQHIEIEMGTAKTGVTFTADELKRFFR